MNSITHITPQLPPALDGVGDYCRNLWRHWPEPRPPVSFLVLHGAEQTRRHWPEVQVRRMSASAGALFEALENTGDGDVVLHYVGYGFQPKGVPRWLADGLTRWRCGSGGAGRERTQSAPRRLITMFHEMYATSSPLRSPFWVKPWARQVIRQLVRASDLWVTNCDRYFDRLVAEFAANPMLGTRIPIGSNIPRAAQLPRGPREAAEWCEARKPATKLNVVLFGLPNTRLWALEGHHRLLRAMVEADLVSSLLVLGKRSDSPDQTQRLAGFQRRVGGCWRSLYDLPPERVARELAQCDVGFVANDAGILTKSGVFAALAGNGVACVAAAKDDSPLRPPFRDCVLLNSDDPREFDSLLAQLQDVTTLTRLRENALAVSETVLSWERIAARWQDHLEGKSAPTTAPSAPLHRRALPAMREQEVPR